jgi:hypothetical protein
METLSESTMTNDVFQNALAVVLAIDGRLAIYRSTMSGARVRIMGVRVVGAYMSAKCVPVETPGLNRGGPPWNIGADVSALAQTGACWSASYAGWQIFFHPAVIQRTLEIVSVLPVGKTHWDDYTREPAPSKSKFAYVGHPGPCARELFSDLDAQALAAIGTRGTCLVRLPE